MKWLIFAFGLAGILPAAQFLNRNPQYNPKVWMLFGVLPFALNPNIALINWSGWPGYVIGVQIAAIDLLAVVLFMNLPRAKRPAPFRIVMVLYFIAMIIPIFFAQVPMAATFYPWQLLRVYFVYVVVRRASSDERALNAILKGMTIGLCLQAVLAGWQKLGLGVLRAEGGLGHENLLGLISEFAIFVPFALLLAGRRGWETTMAPIAGVVVAVFTASRAAVGFGVFGFGIVFLISSLRSWTARKARVLTASVFLVLLVAPIAWSTFQARFEKAPAGADERAMLNQVSAMILADHPFGIGTNQYVVVANGSGYSERANVPWTSAMAIDHNLYWLTAAETGYFGLTALVLLWFKIAFTSLRCAWRFKKDPRGDILLGLGATLLVVALHNAYEWVFLVFNVQYLFAITVGMVAGLTEQLGYWGGPQADHQRAYVQTRSGTQKAS